MRCLVPVLFLLILACGLQASVGTSSPAVCRPLLNTDTHSLQASAQRLYQKATKDKEPLTASPADGKSFINEFVLDKPATENPAEITDNTAPEKKTIQLQRRIRSVRN